MLIIREIAWMFRISREISSGLDHEFEAEVTNLTSWCFTKQFMRTFVGEVFYTLLLLFIDRGLYITHTALISQIAGYCQVRISKTPNSLRRIWDRKEKNKILPLQPKKTCKSLQISFWFHGKGWYIPTGAFVCPETQWTPRLQQYSLIV